jgi:PTS system nitrogen regulatory IIA component
MLFFVAPSPRAHLDLLGALSRLIDRGPLRQLLQAGAADDEILASMTTVTPPRAAAGGPGGRR